MTPFWVYVILKLDTLVTTFAVLGACSAVFSLVWTFLAIVANDFPIPGEKEFAQALISVRKPALTAAIVGLLCIATACLLPSTKQMAALLVLPRNLTEENIDKAANEAGEVYSLAKQWLRDQVDKPGDAERE